MAMRDLILNNFWWKVFSLVLATLIWYVINFSLQTETNASPTPLGNRAEKDLRCPVTVVTSAANRRDFTIHPTEVRVKVRGDRAALEKLSPEDVQVYVKLTDLEDPVGSFLLDVTAPRNVLIQQVSPAHVYVRSVNSTNN